MKPVQVPVALLAAVLLCFTSCQKENHLTPESVASKILGKWQINSVTFNKYYAGSGNKETMAGTPSDYVEFKNDGKVHTFFLDSLSIAGYKVKNAQVILINDDPFSIQELTDNKLRLYSRDETGSFGYTEVTYNLKR